jgi:hypothetical protein
MICINPPNRRTPFRRGKRCGGECCSVWQNYMMPFKCSLCNFTINTIITRQNNPDVKKEILCWTVLTERVFSAHTILHLRSQFGTWFISHQRTSCIPIIFLDDDSDNYHMPCFLWFMRGRATWQKSYEQQNRCASAYVSDSPFMAVFGCQRQIV